MSLLYTLVSFFNMIYNSILSRQMEREILPELQSTNDKEEIEDLPSINFQKETAEYHKSKWSFYLSTCSGLEISKIDVVDSTNNSIGIVEFESSLPNLEIKDKNLQKINIRWKIDLNHWDGDFRLTCSDPRYLIKTFRLFKDTCEESSWYSDACHTEEFIYIDFCSREVDTIYLFEVTRDEAYGRETSETTGKFDFSYDKPQGYEDMGLVNSHSNVWKEEGMSDLSLTYSDSYTDDQVFSEDCNDQEDITVEKASDRFYDENNPECIIRNQRIRWIFEHGRDSYIAYTIKEENSKRSRKIRLINSNLKSHKKKIDEPTRHRRLYSEVVKGPPTKNTKSEGEFIRRILSIRSIRKYNKK